MSEKENLKKSNCNKTYNSRAPLITSLLESKEISLGVEGDYISSLSNP